MRKTILIAISFLIIFTFAFPTENLNSNLMEEIISLKEVSPFTYCSIHHKGPYSDIENIIKQLMMTSRNQNIFPGGPLIGIYYNSPNKVKQEGLEWEIGFPVTPQVMAQAPLEKKQWNFTLVASVIHTGSYEKAAETISKIYEWMEANNLAQTGPLLERYLSMPSPGTRPENLKTEIWIPCQKQKK